MVVRSSRGLLLLLLLFIPRLLPAQEEATAAPAPLGMLLHVDQQEGAGYSDNELLMISRSLLIALQGKLKGMTIVESPQGTPTASPDQLTSQASAAGAEAWLWVEISADGDSTRLRVRVFDISRGQPGIDRAVDREGRLNVFGLPFEKWADLTDLLLGTYPAAAAAIPPEVPGSSVIMLKALPGTRIVLSGAPAVTVDADGRAEITLASPAPYSLRATRAGYHDERMNLFLTKNREIEIAQKANSVWAVEASLKDFGYPGFDAAWFYVPGLLWLRMGFTTYALGINLQGQSTSSSGGEGSVFSSSPLSNLILRAGVYLTPKDRLFRMYSEAGAFLRIFHDPGWMPRLEPISWGGFQLALGTEVSSSRGGAFFLEYLPMVYFTPRPNLFQASLGTDNNPPGWIFTPAAAISLLSFRAGYRWFL
jgi:hypothetical protein